MKNILVPSYRISTLAFALAFIFVSTLALSLAYTLVGVLGWLVQ